MDSHGAAKADEITWAHIWAAVKREVADKGVAIDEKDNDITNKIRDTADRINGLERPKPNEGYALTNGVSENSIPNNSENVNRKYYSYGSEEHLRAAGKRFREVINLTQVYDSTISKSQNMRSGSTFAKMLTSFMGEPTISQNMATDSLWQMYQNKPHSITNKH